MLINGSRAITFDASKCNTHSICYCCNSHCLFSKRDALWRERETRQRADKQIEPPWILTLYNTDDWILRHKVRNNQLRFSQSVVQVRIYYELIVDNIYTIFRKFSKLFINEFLFLFANLFQLICLLIAFSTHGCTKNEFLNRKKDLTKKLAVGYYFEQWCLCHFLSNYWLVQLQLIILFFQLHNIESRERERVMKSGGSPKPSVSFYKCVAIVESGWISYLVYKRDMGARRHD